MYEGNAPDDTQPLLHDPYQHHFAIQEYPDIKVEIQDLKDVYEKVQIKRVLTSDPKVKKFPTSAQRIVQGKVNGVVWTSGQIKKITAVVQRTREAAEKVHDTIGLYTYLM